MSARFGEVNYTKRPRGFERLIVTDGLRQVTIPLIL